jgi:hypothetical protein
MFGSTILDVAIGVVFVFLFVSLIASAIREGIETFLKSRASNLEAGLRELFKDPQGTELLKDFFDHPIIYSLYAGQYTPAPAEQGFVAFLKRNFSFSRQNLPSYIPSRDFALTLMDMAARGPKLDSGTSPDATAPITVDSIRANLGTIENPAVQRALLIALDQADGDLQKAQANLEAWYNSAMDRVSGWYKRSTQWFLICIGLLLAIVFNVNALRIGGTLYHDKDARTLIVESAKSAVADKNGKALDYPDAKAELDQLGLPMGWPPRGLILADFRTHWLSDVSGWLLTALAVSLGAPFWFDMLNKLIVVRSTVKPHQKSPEEPSQDAPSGHSDAANAPSPAPPQAPGPPLQPEAPPAVQAQVDEDGCDVDVTQNITSDQDLPIAIGGVS